MTIARDQRNVDLEIVALARRGAVRVATGAVAKLAVHVDSRADAEEEWGRHLPRDALEAIVRAAAAGRGKVTGVADDPSLYLKVSTARKALTE